MKCKKCGSEWHCAGNIKQCPFCLQDCTLPADEIERMYTMAEALPNEDPAAKMQAYLTVAEYGYAPAEYRLGTCYEDGKGVSPSVSLAAVYYRLAAEQGHADAAFRLAILLRDRHYDTPEADHAYFWLRVAAELGVPMARCYLADCYNHGEGIPANPIRAAYWYTAATEVGSFEAAYSLAELYHEGRGVKKNPAHEKYYAEIAYNGGITAADKLIRGLDGVFSEVPPRIEIKNRNEDRFELGFRAYKEGKYAVAALMYSLAAKDGFARAQNNLGVCLERGHGVPQDEKAAVVWYDLAAKGGYQMAWLNLGDCYRYGRGVQADEAKAFSCYLTAAENGHARAQYVVGNCYFDAQLVDRNMPEAMKWYERSALQGYGEAMEKINSIRADMTELYNYGVNAYEKGKYEDAVRFYTIAAECGHRGAQCNLGYCYQQGQGCEKNDRLAVRYYQKAADQESGIAELNLAFCYLRGEGGLPYSYKKANDYLHRALRHGVAQAQEVLDENKERRKRKIAQKIYAASAAMLARGAENAGEALRFRRIAAQLGNPRAMCALACHYEFGFGVPMDEDAALAWFERARAAGFMNASRMKGATLKLVHQTMAFRRPSEQK